VPLLGEKPLKQHIPILDYIMKTSTKRSIPPPPIDLSVSGSNFMRDTTTSHGLAGELVVGDPYPCAYGGRRVLSADRGVVPLPLSTPPRRKSSLKSTRIRTPALPATNNPITSPSDETYLSTSQWDSSRLVPNRRRSYSEVSNPLNLHCIPSTWIRVLV